MGKETNCVFILRNEVQDVQMLSDTYVEKAHRLRGSRARQLWDGGDFGIGDRLGGWCASGTLYLNFFSAKNMAQCPLE